MKYMKIHVEIWERTKNFMITVSNYSISFKWFCIHFHASHNSFLLGTILSHLIQINWSRHWLSNNSTSWVVVLFINNFTSYHEYRQNIDIVRLMGVLKVKMGYHSKTLDYHCENQVFKPSEYKKTSCGRHYIFPSHEISQRAYQQIDHSKIYQRSLLDV
jgi:hypothetical protein